MKTIHKTIFPISLGLIAAVPALAIEPPKDDAPPPPSVKSPSTKNTGPAVNPEIAQKAAPEKIRKAFIGIVAANLPEILATHLGTKPGEGIVINGVAPGGPAEQAGFERYDVITRVSGKPVGSPAEFSQLIAGSKAGDEVSVDFIHQGKADVRTVKLGALPNTPARVEDPRQLGHLDFSGMPEDQANRIRDMIEGRLRGGFSEEEMDADPPPRPRRGPAAGGISFRSDATFRLMDNEGSVEVKSTDGSKKITVKDKENNVTWSGPWDSEEDKSAAPPEVRERIERFKFDENLRGKGFRLRLGPDEQKAEE